MKTKTFLRSAGLLLALLCLQLPVLQANPNDSLSVWIQPWIETAHADLDQLERDYADHIEPFRIHARGAAKVSGGTITCGNASVPPAAYKKAKRA